MYQLYRAWNWVRIRNDDGYNAEDDGADDAQPPNPNLTTNDFLPGDI